MKTMELKVWMKPVDRMGYSQQNKFHKLMSKIIISYAAALIIVTAQTAHADIAFEDRTLTAGLTTSLYGGYGSSWVDFDGDGLLDVWISNHMYRPSLYINNGDGTFSERLSEFWQGKPFLDAHGGAWADFDNDGDPDLIELYGTIGGTAKINKPFYVNQASILTNEADARGLNDSFGRGRTPLWLDWNNDGLLDVYMINYLRPDTLGPSRLMLQQNNGSFVPISSMTMGTKSFSAQLAYFDSATHLVFGGGPYPNKLYRLGEDIPLPVAWEPNSKILNVKDVAVADFDGDLSDDLLAVRAKSEVNSWLHDPDNRRQVLVDVHKLSQATTGAVNFRLTGTSRLVIQVYGSTWTPDMIRVGTLGDKPAEYVFNFINERRWKIIELSLDAADPAVWNIMSENLRVTSGIYVGWNPDLAQWRIEVRGKTNFRAKFLSTDTEFTSVTTDGGALWTKNIGLEPILLTRHNGKFFVTDLGVNEAFECTSVAAGDFDNDMDIDLYLSCGVGLQNKPNLLLENIGGGAFVRVANAPGVSTKRLGTGGRVSVADYDNDGYLDLLVTDGGEHEFPFHFGRRYLLHNKGGGNHWLKIVLEGCQSNRDGIGARVVVQAGGQKQARLQGGGTRNGIQDDRRLHFGLAQNTFAESVVIEWPSGARTNLTNLPADQIHIVQENSNCPRS